MKKLILLSLIFVSCATVQATDWGRLLSGALKAGTAATITDEQLIEAVRSEIKELDSQNKVCGAKSPYTKRLKRLTKGMNNANGIKLA